MTSPLSLPGLTRQSTILRSAMDAWGIGEQSDAVLRPAKPTHDVAKVGASTIGRRALIAGLAGSAAALPFAVRAQERLRRIGLLMALAENDTEGQFRVAAFVRGLRQLGWLIGRSIRIDYRWTSSRPELLRKSADELVALAPDVILAAGTPAVVPLLQASRNTPIVFVNVADPVGAGFVATLARPGGNVTGFMQFEFRAGDRRLELLREMAPRLARAAVLRDHTQPAGLAQFTAVQSAAKALGIDVTAIDVRVPAEIERAVAAFARQPDGGLVVTVSESTVLHRDLIVRLAARHKLPALYDGRFFAAAGGLMSYGPDLNEQYRLAAGYADRILKGEQPAELPVQSSNKYLLVLNAKTAGALGLVVPLALLSRADEVIQ